MVCQHRIKLESRRLRLGPLVVQCLIGSAHPAIQNGSHGAGFVSSRLLSTFADVPKAVSTSADGFGGSFHVTSEPCLCGHQVLLWGSYASIRVIQP
jgi:hypothetical protein